jgi:hypothetical protein
MVKPTRTKGVDAAKLEQRAEQERLREEEQRSREKEELLKQQQDEENKRKQQEEIAKREYAKKMLEYKQDLLDNPDSDDDNTEVEDSMKSKRKTHTNSSSSTNTTTTNKKRKIILADDDKDNDSSSENSSSSSKNKSKTTSSNNNKDKKKRLKSGGGSGSGGGNSESKRKKRKIYPMQEKSPSSAAVEWDQQAKCETYDEYHERAMSEGNQFLSMPEFPSSVDRSQELPGKILENFIGKAKELYFDVLFPTSLPWQTKPTTTATRRKDSISVPPTLSSTSNTTNSSSNNNNNNATTNNTNDDNEDHQQPRQDYQWIYCGEFCTDEEGNCWLDVPGETSHSHRLYLEMEPKSSSSNGIAALVMDEKTGKKKLVIENNMVYQAQFVPNWSSFLDSRHPPRDGTEQYVELSSEDTRMLNPWNNPKFEEKYRIDPEIRSERLVENDRSFEKKMQEKLAQARRDAGEFSSSEGEEDGDGQDEEGDDQVIGQEENNDNEDDE